MAEKTTIKRVSEVISEVTGKSPDGLRFAIISRKKEWAAAGIIPEIRQGKIMEESS